MLYTVNRFFRRIYNLYRWFPVIWKDEQWDYYHIYEVLKCKLILTAEHARKHGYHVHSQDDANRMMLCVRLIEKAQNDEYMELLINDDNLTAEKIEAATSKQDKVRRLLFKILEQNIEKWWN